MSAQRPLNSSADVRGGSFANVRPLLDAEQAAGLLNVPKSWVLAEARADRVPHVRLGRYVRFDADELLWWARARQRGPRALRTGRDPVAPGREAA